MKTTLIATALLVLPALACSDKTAPEALKIASLEIVGNNQTAVVGSELATTVTVKAVDARSVAVPSQIINFVVVKGGGTVFAGSALTNAAGEAKERWTLGDTPGENILEARAVDQTTGAPIVHAQIKATAVVGPPSNITGGQTTITSRVEVEAWIRLTDAKGNPVQGVLVTWAVVSGSPVLSTNSSQTDSDGRAAVRYTVNNILGSHQISGTVEGFPVQTFGVTNL